MKGNFCGISGIFFYLYVGKTLPKCDFAACEHHHGARARARAVVFTAETCFRQIDKNSSDGNAKKVLQSEFWWHKFDG